MPGRKPIKASPNPALHPISGRPEFRLLFCSDPINPRQPDTAFGAEVEAARACGIEILRVDHEALDHAHDARKAIRYIPKAGSLSAVYRGWMLRADDYRLLYDALTAAGIVLVNTPEQYAAMLV